MVRWRRLLLVMAGAAVAGCAIWVLIRRYDNPQTPEESITDATIVMLGDSITAQGRWSELLPDRPIVNSGRDGFTTQQLLPVARAVARRQPQAVIILTGTNDIRDGHEAAWTVEHLAAIVDVFRSFAPDTQVVLQTILPRADAPDAVREANAAITRLAAERDLPLIDLHRDFDDGRGGLRANETEDGIHLTSAGYTRWAAVLRSELSSLL